MRDESGATGEAGCVALLKVVLEGTLAGERVRAVYRTSGRLEHRTQKQRKSTELVAMDCWRVGIDAAGAG